MSLPDRPDRRPDPLRPFLPDALAPDAPSPDVGLADDWAPNADDPVLEETEDEGPEADAEEADTADLSPESPVASGAASAAPVEAVRTFGPAPDRSLPGEAEAARPARRPRPEAHQAASSDAQGPADAVNSWLMARLPTEFAPFLSLSRVDRPVGFWLLALPCLIGLAHARLSTGWSWHDPFWIVLFVIGAIAMRGAGCTWNDIQDRDVDAQVERTKGRPLPAGLVTVTQAWAWLAAQLGAAFVVWLFLPGDAKIAALLALPLVAVYPFMKRLTWWPQAWLGAAFSWGVLVAGATAGTIGLASVVLFLGLIAWTIAYDTIYAAQDVEDDALIGVKSTARLFGERMGLGVFAFFALSAALIGLAFWMADAGRLGALAVLAFFLHGTWQVLRLKRSQGGAALPIFRSNVTAGVIMFAGLALAVLFGAGNRPEPVAREGTPIRVERPVVPFSEPSTPSAASPVTQAPPASAVPQPEPRAQAPALVPYWQTAPSPAGTLSPTGSWWKDAMAAGAAAPPPPPVWWKREMQRGLTNETR
jgi:4-hydroxybenzoate polyprenyltransferase